MVIYSEIPSRCSTRRLFNISCKRNSECRPNHLRYDFECDLESGERAVWKCVSKYRKLLSISTMEVGMVSSSTAQRRPHPSSQDASTAAQRNHGEKDTAEDEEDDDDDDVTVVILDAQYQSPRRSATTPHGALINSSLAVPYDDLGEGVRTEQDLQYSLVRQQTRRNEMVQELRVVQRSSFRLFLAILVLPVVLLVVAVAAVMTDDVDCSGMAPTTSQIADGAVVATANNGTSVDSQPAVVSCWNEQRTFRNAFTTRCICDSVPASTN